MKGLSGEWAGDVFWGCKIDVYKRQISNRTYVLEVGNLVASGDSKVLMDSDDIKKAYLGG